MEIMLDMVKSLPKKIVGFLAYSVRFVAQNGIKYTAAGMKKTYDVIGKKALKKVRPFTETLMIVSGIIAMFAAVCYVAGGKD